ncbi:helix-turn-helix transcriptional regulator [Halorubellus sp. JP-L1]|uniref:DUF7344 domain-containing protein n=1 Tax=Halorubellus sp. JP-L1 TaxID=2715753 RepID=UPI00140A9F8D|nr:helix-turn-helix transcriptional regulator [Halorubellus sp. JP-L1]NHN41802.1 helix-turn-helix transcriptional regulator [Halorubellus sp. JP-L1]
MSKAQPKTGGVDSTTASDARQTDVDGTEDETPEGPSDDELFELLANQRRRFVLHHLAQQPGEPVSLSTLSEHVAGWEHGVAPTELDYRERKSVRNSLHQFHLPKLDDAGIVAYDDRGGEVSLRDDAVVDAYHAISREDDAAPWAAYAIGGVAGAVATAGLVAVGLLPDTGVATLAITVLAAALAAVAHFSVDRFGDGDADLEVPPPECER